MWHTKNSHSQVVHESGKFMWRSSVVNKVLVLGKPIYFQSTSDTRHNTAYQITEHYIAVYKLILIPQQTCYCSKPFSFCVTYKAEYIKVDFKSLICLSIFIRFRAKKNDLCTINLRQIMLALYLLHFSVISLKIQHCLE